MGFKDLNIRPSRVVNAVASTAFGVYLIHDHELVRQWLWKGVVHTQDYANTPWIIPYMLLCTVAVFIACMLIDLARQRFIEPLYMRLIDRLLLFGKGRMEKRGVRMITKSPAAPLH